MKNKTYKWTKKEQNLVLEKVKEAKELLNMQSWVITNEFHDGKIKEEQESDGKVFISSAYNTVTQEYEKITITWEPAMLEEIRRTGLSIEVVFHEMIHALTAELYELSMNRFITENQCRLAVERLTQRITRIVCNLL
jgi:uncharacterized protein (DUF488 family)